MSTFSGKVGFVRPTFEEYPNRYDMAKSVMYTPEDRDFRYSVDDLMSFFGNKGLEALVLINPDNPTGNYIPKAEVERLMGWAEAQNVRLVYDESFSDFADELGNSFVDDALLEKYPHAVVVKSISKSYGVPGLRLGIMLSADEKLIAHTKKDVGIWNINSFGEFYLQIAEKYLGDYKEGLERFRASRARLVEELSTIGGLRVLPSQANFLMVELDRGCATDVTQRLLCDYKLLVKDLSGKIRQDRGQFLRLAVRNDDDNALLAKALREVLSS